MTADFHAAIMLAVLLSLVAGPAALRAVLAAEQRRADAALAAAVANAKTAVVFYRLNVRALDRWGLLPDILRCLDDQARTGPPSASLQ